MKETSSNVFLEHAYLFACSGPWGFKVEYDLLTALDRKGQQIHHREIQKAGLHVLVTEER